MSKIILTNIQRGSLHDGPGVRITYFFQGCNLRCEWCHNPETIPFSSRLMYHKNKCVGCGLCASACQNRLEKEKCVNCGSCAEVCPAGARVMSGKEYDPKELVDIALRELKFISNGGGITYSGGEPMLQAKGLTELLRQFKEKGIHTAVDTAANIPWEKYALIMPYTDTFLVDYKLSDSTAHKRYTGVPRELIAENIKRFAVCGKDVIIRMPIIPGVNDNTDHANAAGRELSGIGFSGVIELLPFHRLGSAKYTALGKEYKYSEISPPSDLLMAELKACIGGYGLNVKK